MIPEIVERLRQRERKVLNGRRPLKGRCPGCGVPSYTWCRHDCTLVDPVDYR